ncbi:Methyltransferase domain [Gaiella occulta]|uniref:Methyltransferase domain n=1 Tax=Gaiella occulta TaxID=1002870 RepID=A0A7M2YYU7_9ACTN|nr:methyltransferase domain-containing protein [Gaiella occulta]RDI75335.1 Methyltransferase domain [Gaiella occulta]
MAFEQLKQRHAEVWSSAPFENIAETIADTHDELAERLGPRPGERWLDLACGAGDVAFRAARGGAEVTGSDLAPALVEAARRRAAEAGLDITLEVADCESLPYPDASFDVVSSGVGVIFAPDHARVAAELARVCRPGGRLGLTAWRAESGVGAMFRTMAPFLPPPPDGAGSPFQWGDEAYAERMLGRWFELEFVELDSRYEGDSAEQMWAVFRDNYGPTHTLWWSLDEERRARLDRDMVALMEESRRADGRISVERRYIVILGVRREAD